MNSRLLPLLAVALAVILSPVTAQDDFVLGNKGQAVTAEPGAEPVPLPAEVELRRAEPGTDPIEIGDPVELRISLSPHPEAQRGTATAIKVAPQRGSATPFVLRGQPRQLTSGQWAVEATVLVAPDDGFFPGAQITATFEDGSVAVYAAGPFEAPVNAPVADPDGPRDYTPAIEAPFNWARALVLGGAATVAGIAVLGALAALVIFLWKRRPVRIDTGTPPVAPLDEARASIVQLESLETFRIDGTKEHYLALSFALRRYFERAYGFSALEMTDDELIDRIRTDMAANGGAQLLPRVFEAASLAKFAKWATDEEHAASHVRVALSFLDAEIERQRAARENAAEKKEAA